MENYMSNSNTAAPTANDEGTSQARNRTSISFKPKKASRSKATMGSSTHKQGAEKPSEKTPGIPEVLDREPLPPINQRYRQLTETGGFARSDPERPSKRHRAEGMDGTRTSEEIYALGDLLMVNTNSIARRTPYPEALLWPLVGALARVIEEYLDETSEYEMGELDGALLELETASGGKVRFARSTASTTPT